MFTNYTAYETNGRGYKMAERIEHLKAYMELDADKNPTAFKVNMSDNDLYLFGKDVMDLAFGFYRKCYKSMGEEAYFMLRRGDSPYKVVSEMNSYANRFNTYPSKQVVQNLTMISMIINVYVTEHLHRGW